MANKQDKAMEVLSQLDGATLNQLMMLLQSNDRQQESKQEKVTKASLYRQRTREIPVRSYVDGRVIYKSKKTGVTYKWLEKGAYEILTIDEILNMESQSHKFLHSPWLVVDDEEVIEAFNLTDLYQSLEKVEDIDSFISLPCKEQQEIYDNLPKSVQKQVYNHIYNKVDSGEIDSRAKIKQLEELVKIELVF